MAYAGLRDLNLCPEFRRFAKNRGCENPGHLRSIRIEPQNSYTMNAYLGSERGGAVARLKAVRDPAAVFLFAEENSWTLRPDHPKFPVKELIAPLSTRALDDTALLISATGAADSFATYHGASSSSPNSGWSHMIFVDGHSDYVRFSDQLRRRAHGGSSEAGPAGNLARAWAASDPPPGGWDSY
jgi:hypothetical protein